MLPNISDLNLTPKLLLELVSTLKNGMKTGRWNYPGNREFTLFNGVCVGAGLDPETKKLYVFAWPKNKSTLIDLTDQLDLS